MDGLRKMRLHERDHALRSTSHTSDSFTRVAAVVPFNWEEQPGKPKSRSSMKQKHEVDSSDEAEAHEPRVVQLNLKASLMGVHIVDDEETFFSRQSSMSSMTTEKFRSAGKVPFKWEAEPGKPIEPGPKKPDKDPIGVLLPPPGSRAQSGVLFPHLHGTGGRLPSGMLYPQGGAARAQSGMLHNPNQRAHSGILLSPHPPATPGNRGNSGMMNAAFFSIDGGGLTGTDHGLPSSTPNLTEKIFKKLVGQSRLSQARDRMPDVESNEDLDRHSEFNLHEEVDSDSRVSTLDLPDSCPASPSSSERSFRARPATQLPVKQPKNVAQENRRQSAEPPVDSVAPGPKSSLAQYLVAITAMADETDDDDIVLHGPSDVAWHQAESEQQYHPELPVVEGYRQTRRKSKNAPTQEHWTSNSSSWNLSLVQKPLKTVSTMVNRNKHNIHHTVPSLSRNKSSKTLTSNARGQSEAPASSRCISRGMKSETGSGRTRWSEIETSRNRVLVLGSGHLHLGCSDEPDSLEPHMEAPDHVGRPDEDVARKSSVDEEDFPFESPIASSFVFGEADKKHMTEYASIDDTNQFTGRTSLPRSSTAEPVGNRDHWQQSRSKNMPSSTDSELGGSLTFSLERVSGIGMLDQPPQWVPSRNFNSVKELVDSYASISGRALSGFVEIGRISGRSGRFSIDLQTSSKLGQSKSGSSIHHAEGVVRATTSSPDVRLRIDVVNTQKPRHHHSKRSGCIFAPCLPFLDRHKKDVSNRIQLDQATTLSNSVPGTTSAVATTTTTKQLQTMNSFQARLGPGAFYGNNNLDPRSSASASTSAQFQFFY